jgi:hypothetical protein
MNFHSEAARFDVDGACKDLVSSNQKHFHFESRWVGLKRLCLRVGERTAENRWFWKGQVSNRLHANRRSPSIVQKFAQANKQESMKT